MTEDSKADSYSADFLGVAGAEFSEFFTSSDTSKDWKLAIIKADIKYRDYIPGEDLCGINVDVEDWKKFKDKKLPPGVIVNYGDVNRMPYLVYITQEDFSKVKVFPL